MMKCVVFGCFNNAPLKTGLCAEHRPAKAIDARSDKTACGLGPKGESAVGNADLPKPRNPTGKQTHD